ncbi:cysteine hydrolase [Jiella sp. MQZ13P-4]|uniref:Cysteine hydrolase n=1 Tax=Jiella sonneratiae TaxID=2816856 RepID=A0ABS3J918_9HYPH|nr:cysteine hydrolase [Jiella sonneratiae]
MASVTARPFDFPLDPARAALIVIDMQRDFLEPGGFGESLGNDVSRLQAIVPATARLIEGFRAARLPVIHTRECHRPDLSDCPPAKRLRGAPGLRIGDPGPMGRILIAGEPGAEIVPALCPAAGEAVIDKPGKGAFHATGLTDHLAGLGITQLVFAGVTTEVCVQTTMREANDRGYECLLAEDATESYFAEFKRVAIDMITAQGAIVGWAAPVAAILEGLAARQPDEPDEPKQRAPKPAEAGERPADPLSATPIGFGTVL